jgi:hypothetical protein
MRAIEINPNLTLELSITAEEILADLVYPEPVGPLYPSAR